MLYINRSHMMIETGTKPTFPYALAHSRVQVTMVYCLLKEWQVTTSKYGCIISCRWKHLKSDHVGKSCGQIHTQQDCWFLRPLKTAPIKRIHSNAKSTPLENVQQNWLTIRPTLWWLVRKSHNLFSTLNVSHYLVR